MIDKEIKIIILLFMFVSGFVIGSMLNEVKIKTLEGIIAEQSIDLDDAISTLNALIYDPKCNVTVLYSR